MLKQGRTAVRLQIIAVLPSSLFFFITGCTSSSVTKPSEELPSIGDSPMSPLTVNLLFPDGAPRLNQIALLVITVKANYMDATNMIVRVNLPEALELVSGELSWNGSVIKGDQVDVIKATVKSVKTGNWQIGIYKYVNPDENGFGADGEVPFYISISEDSAQWGKTPPWYKGGNEIPIQPSK